jgi:MauM/NapG family ferredoxin protein
MKTNLSRVFQILFLVLFLALFVTTEYRGKDEISLAINSFFRTDPLVVLSYVLSVKAFSLIFLPGFLMITFSFIIGRFFCGWICPLGTILDLLSVKIKKSITIRKLSARFKYYLLFILLAMSLFGVNFTGIFDPLAILIRFLTFSVFPVVGYVTRSGWSGLYGLIGDKRDSLLSVYGFLKDYVLPFRETFYPLAFFSFATLGAIILLERYEKRYWCKNLCPLGTLLGIFSSFSILKRLPGRICSDCRDCKDICPTAFDEDILQKKDCILCMNCAVKCKNKRVKFTVHGFNNGLKQFAWDRRLFVSSFFFGFFLSKLFVYLPEDYRQRLIRPPGAQDEKDFLKKCVRCGECMKICLKNALYPAFTQAGLYGMYTPVLIARKGYCEYNCTLCGQVCPTKAIPELPVEEKKKAVIGIAVFDKNHCLPFAKKINCIVCEEHCPIPDKAIKLEDVREKDYSGKEVLLKKPYVVDNLCTGCGICEYVCPLEDKAGIEMFAKKNVKETRYGNS